MVWYGFEVVSVVSLVWFLVEDEETGVGKQVRCFGGGEGERQ